MKFGRVFLQFRYFGRSSSQSGVRVRFAPSPTGQLHLGGLRTALYNYLFARKHDGSFVLRIEDTDQARLVPGSVANIVHSINHYGLKPDEGPNIGGQYGPYMQSERLPHYKETVEQLLESGHAYRCFCTEERLELLRKTAAKENAIPKYDRRCRSLSKEEATARARAGEAHVVRFVMDVQNVAFKDEVFGDVTQCLDESDMILLKSDGFPTYHLANVVDDRKMEISHVIRGMEWLSSTGKHVSLYRAFGWQPPKWVHLTLITRDGKKKLSKRDKDAFVEYYEKELGALPTAVLNLLIRNGSGIENFDDQHFYSLEEMVRSFSVEKLGRRNLQLDHDCLDRSCRKAFHESSIDELLPVIRQKIETDCLSLASIDDEFLRKVVSFLQSNEEKFAYLSSLTSPTGQFHWMLTKPSSGTKINEHYSNPVILLEKIVEKEAWSADSLRTLATTCGISGPQLMGLLRLALIDSKKGPPIAELVAFFGVEECRQRVEHMLNMLKRTKVENTL